MTGAGPAARDGWRPDGGIDEIPLPAGNPGRLWVCGRRYVGPDPDAVLADVDAHLVVCLTLRDELRQLRSYVDWLEDNAGGKALWHPVPDLHAPTLDDAVGLVSAIRTRLDGGDGVVVHCAGGIGRAPTVAICVLLSMGMPLDDALDHVRTHRRSGGPEAGSQRRLVEEFAARQR